MYLDSWIEAELCSPGKDIAPNDSLQFVSNWYATKLAGAVRAVNNAGAIKDSLFVNALSGTFTGTYGVFHQGTVKICFNGQQLLQRDSVSPLATFTLTTRSPSPPLPGRFRFFSIIRMAFSLTRSIPRSSGPWQQKSPRLP